MLYTNYFIDIVRQFNPEQPLLVDGNKIMTSGKLLDSSRQLAQGLIQNGVKRGDRVVMAVQPGIEFLQVMYANMMIRTVVSIIDPQMGRDHYRAKLTQFNPHHAFVDSKLVLLSEHPLARFVILKFNKAIPDFPLLKKVNVFTTGLKLPIFQRHINIRDVFQSHNTSDFIEGNDSDDFLVTYTSGTLAEPKGVVHSYTSLANSIHYLAGMLKQNGDEAIATHLPQFVLLGISAGVKVYLWDNNLSATRKLEFIAANSITTLFGPPSEYLPMVQHLAKVNGKFPTCLKSIFLGSAPVHSAFLSKLLACCEHCNVTNLYGMTENLMVTYQDAREKVKEKVEGDLVGTPFPNVKLKIEMDGEISLQSDQLFTRYWYKEEKVTWHATGDLGVLDDRGRLILQGRKKDMIIRRNFNIYPGLYEPTINKIPGVIESAMMGVYNKEKADEEIVLVLEIEHPITEENVVAKLSDGPYSIDREALPDQILFMTLPRSGRQNKVNRLELSRQIEDRLA